ncbi:serine/threonine protein kinase, CMGC, CDC2/CDK sub [Fusarium torreyae]|uniref:Serine/threonine protein kinase, CMGC, CDC2/CDK sub n=1 Tax=Fusarium torreyae TaxID=1237075 RepID=A0A9W8S9Q1_9HYPO|nr:serine/threonine protein kinase, CMGC, CDC2/CDK sub [Fusarium torreyae]
MEYPSKPPRRPRHAAMRDDQERNDQGERARAERGVKPSQRSRSPRQVRESRRGSDSRRDRPSTRPEPRPSRRRRHSRDRSRDRAARPSPEPSRRGPEVDDLIPRYRAERERHREAEDKSRRRSKSRSRSRDQISRNSSSAPKRHRSRRVHVRGQGITVPNPPLGSTLDILHATDVNHLLAATDALLDHQHVHVQDPRHSQTQPRDVQIVTIDNDQRGLVNVHGVVHSHQRIGLLRPDESTLHLLKTNESRTWSRHLGDSLHHGHLTQVENGDLEKGRLAGVIPRDPTLTKT